MSWTVKVKQFTKIPESRSFQVSLEFDNGAGTVFTQNDKFGNLSKLEKYCRAVVAKVDEFDSTSYDVDEVVLDTSLDTDPPEPTQEELDRTQWRKDYTLLQRMNVAIAQNILSDTNPTYISLVQKVKNNFIPSYIDLIAI